MTAEPGGEKPQKSPEGSALPTWRRIGEFIRNVLTLERTIEALKKDNQRLDERVDILQRQVDDQTGQLKVLMEFVRGALDDRIESRIRRALDERSLSAAKATRSRRKSAPGSGD